LFYTVPSILCRVLSLSGPYHWSLHKLLCVIAGSVVLVNTVDVQLAFPLFHLRSLAAAFCFIFAHAASNFAAASSSACCSPYTFDITLSKTLGRFIPYISSMVVCPVSPASVIFIHSYVCGSSSAQFLWLS